MILLNSVQKFIEMKGWLLLTLFFCLHKQLNYFNSIIVRMSGRRFHQIDSKNELLLLSVTFTGKFELVFVLTFENAFSLRFHFKANRKSINSSKVGTRDFQNSPPF